MTGNTFVPRRTTRLKTPPDGDLDVLRVGQAFGDRIKQITGIHVRFGGSCFDITWNTEENALQAATEGVAINGETLDLRPLGLKKTDVSVFVAVEFPDEALKEVLQRYGDFEPAIRRLRLKEKGFQHIENGVRVVSFTRILQPIPNTIVCQGIPIGFRYTGQVKLCFKCASPDHEVRDCPTRNKAKQDEQKEQEQQQDSDASSDEEKEMDTTRQRQATKRTRPESDTEERPPKHTATDDDATFDPSQSLFAAASTATTDNELTDNEQNKQTDNNKTETETQDGFKPVTGDGLKRMLAALKKKGKSRTEMMQAVPGPQYYKARALWLQYTHGDFSERIAEQQHCSENESDRWSELSGCIKQDAYAKLLELFGSLQEQYGLFTAK